MPEHVQHPGSSWRRQVEFFFKPSPTKHHVVNQVVSRTQLFIWADWSSMYDFELAIFDHLFYLTFLLISQSCAVPLLKKIKITNSVRPLRIEQERHKHWAENLVCCVDTIGNGPQPSCVQMRVGDYMNCVVPFCRYYLTWVFQFEIRLRWILTNLSARLFKSNSLCRTLLCLMIYAGTGSNRRNRHWKNKKSPNCVVDTIIHSI